MEDSKIIDLFWRRDESALKEFEKSVGKPCLRAAREITGDSLDAEECFSDTCLAVWNSIPPAKPDSLCGYALRICKNFALNVVKARSRRKRSAILVELDECVTDSIPDLEPDEIGRLIDGFLEKLPRREAIIFVRRYNLSEPVKDIAAALGMTENQVSKILQKLRGKLKKHLSEGGVNI